MPRHRDKDRKPSYRPPKPRRNHKQPGEETRSNEGSPTRDYSWSSTRYMEDGVSYHDDPTLNHSDPWRPQGGLLQDTQARSAEEAVAQQDPYAGRAPETGEEWGPDLRDAVAAQYARAGLPYSVAAARYQKATGHRLTPGLYTRVADQEGQADVIRIVSAPRYRCDGCNMAFEAYNDNDPHGISCPSCGSMGVTSMDEGPAHPGGTSGISTEKLYMNQNHDFGDSPPAHGASFQPASEIHLGPGDLIRNAYSDNVIKIEAASEQWVRGVSLVSGHEQEVAHDDLWAWEVVGVRIDGSDLITEESAR